MENQQISWHWQVRPADVIVVCHCQCSLLPTVMAAGQPRGHRPHAFRQLFLSCCASDRSDTPHFCQQLAVDVILPNVGYMSPECFISFFNLWNERGGVQSRTLDQTLPTDLGFILSDLQFCIPHFWKIQICIRRIEFFIYF